MNESSLKKHKMKQVTLSFCLVVIVNSLFAQWSTQTGTNNIFYNAGNVGVGTSAPGANLVVNGKARVVSTLSVGADQDGPGFFGIYLAANTQIGFNVAGQPTDQKIWSLLGNGNTFRLLTQKDDFSAIQEAFRVTRGTGINIATFAFPTGNVLIGEQTQVNAAYKLDVNGDVRANRVVVNSTGADFVFDTAYKLPRLTDIHQYVLQYHHLPGIVPAREMRARGLDLADNQTKLLQKIEELTLYSIQQDQKIEALEEANKRLTLLEKEVAELKELLKKR